MIPVAAMMARDAAADINLVVYLPLSRSRMRTHEAQRWYVRPSRDTADEPRSRPFDSARDALAAVRDGSWDLMTSRADERPVRRR